MPTSDQETSLPVAEKTDMMPAPTKEETQEFIKKNESFFITSLTNEGQKELQQFYKNNNAIDKIANYSQQLGALLYKHRQPLSQESSTPVIYAWQKGNVAPALEHEEVRQFIMDNKEHPAIVMWANKKSVIELNKSGAHPKKQETSLPTPEKTKIMPTPTKDETTQYIKKNESGTQPKKQKTSLPTPEKPKTLSELTKEFLNMKKDDFNAKFDPNHIHTLHVSEGILMNHRLINEEFSGALFETQEAFNQWRKEIISTKDNQTQKQKTSLSTSEKTKIMTAPTKEETQQFIKNNESFFITSLTNEGQKELQQFYKNNNAIDKIANYAQQLGALLYKHRQPLSQENSTPVIYAWQKGNVAPALEHKEVRQFIMDNKEHPAIVMWANKKSVLELNESGTQKQETSLPLIQTPKTLPELTTNFLNMKQDRFDELFSNLDTRIVRYSNADIPEAIGIHRRLIGAGVSGALFETPKAYEDWRNNIISTKNTQTQKQEISLLTPEKAKELTESIISAVKNFCSAMTVVISLIDKIENKNEGLKL